MRSLCRRAGVAAYALLGLSLVTTGCLAPRYQEAMAPPPGCATCQNDGRPSLLGGRNLGQPANLPPNMMPGQPMPGQPVGMTPGGYPSAYQGDVQRVGFFQDSNDVPRAMPNATTADPRAMPGGSGPASTDPRAMAYGPAHPMPGSAPPMPGCPAELRMTSHPPYTIAPPDILVIDGTRLIPKPPYRIEALEALIINVTETLPNQPITGQYVVSPEGTVNLGFTYGAVRVGGLTLDEAQRAIREHLGTILRAPQVTVSLAQFRAVQLVRGEHLIRPDGTISLGSYGAVYVAGLTLGQAKCVIEKHLSEYLLNPQISIDVFAYNSKHYYVILDGAGLGQLVYRFPVTGNETVLDAISQVQGLAPVSSKKRIWLARPSPVHVGCNQLLPVDWNAITQGASTGTNYQIFPGDRVYVQGDPLVRFDTWLAKVISPIERVLGVTLLGASTFQTLSGNNNTGVIVGQ